MIGVKSKCCNQYGRDTFWFCRGSDIVFEYMKFMRSSRGTFRCGISNVRISNVLIRKDGPNWCLGISYFRFFYFENRDFFILKMILNPAGNYMFKVNNRNTRTRCEICSKLTIKTPKRRQ